MNAAVMSSRLSSLADLEAGRGAWVMHVALEDGFRARLAALGFLPGQWLEIVRRAPFGGPLHVRLGLTDVIIRQQDALAIQVA